MQGEGVGRQTREGRAGSSGGFKLVGGVERIWECAPVRLCLQLYPSVGESSVNIETCLWAECEYQLD